MSSFRALVLNQAPDRRVSGKIETLPEDKLPTGDVTIAVEYSTLNYKDGLVLTTGGGLVKTWPHVGGIDFAGTVEKSDNPGFKPGDKVVLNGWRVGELQWGGYASRARVKGDWLVKLPASISPAARHGDRHRRLYLHALRHGAGEASACARPRARCW
jgi:acrylyl-CoA reductase (NADPH)